MLFYTSAEIQLTYTTALGKLGKEWFDLMAYQ